MRSRPAWRAVVLLAVTVTVSCSSPTTPSSAAEFAVDVDGERFVEPAIEVCDGRPSYVEQHRADYPTYCPWSARVVGRR